MGCRVSGVGGEKKGLGCDRYVTIYDRSVGHHPQIVIVKRLWIYFHKRYDRSRRAGVGVE